MNICTVTDDAMSRDLRLNQSTDTNTELQNGCDSKKMCT